MYKINLTWYHKFFDEFFVNPSIYFTSAVSECIFVWSILPLDKTIDNKLYFVHSHKLRRSGKEICSEPKKGRWWKCWKKDFKREILHTDNPVTNDITRREIDICQRLETWKNPVWHTYLNNALIFSYFRSQKYKQNAIKKKSMCIYI